MIASTLWLALACVLQVPPPNAAANVSNVLKAQERTILESESAQVNALAEALDASGQSQAAHDIRRVLPAATSDGPTRFVPLPDVVPATPKPKAEGLANVPTVGKSKTSTNDRWRSDLDQVRERTGKALFDLATRTATAEPKHYAMAQRCLRGVIERIPDHSEARRLLGFVPHEGGWATPYAVSQIRDKKVLHPVYGWVPATWVEPLEKGELPAPRGSAQKRDTWLPAAEANALRRDWDKAWRIDTEHFTIRTNVPLSEAIAFGRRLEAFHDLFLALLADVIGEKLPLAQRFRSRTKTGESQVERHQVFYFATRDEFIEHLRPIQGESAEQILGVYLPPQGRARRAPAYFFRDKDGPIDVNATLYHEVSHQLLFESGPSGLNDWKKNVGNYWVFEGLGTYFETLTPQPDGSLEIGGLISERLLAARQSLVQKKQMVPLVDFVRLDQERFNDETNIFLHYQEAAALATFLMQSGQGRYRDAFLDYVKDAYQGKIRRVAGRSLEDRLDAPYAQLQQELLAYLAAQPAGN